MHVGSDADMEFVSGEREGLPPGVFPALSRYRYDVFVTRLGWDLPATGGIELDQFDRRDTVYVAARDKRERIAGCARLLPTTRPYLLGDVFPQLLGGAAPPRQADVWELSRFSALDLEEPSSGLGAFPSSVAADLLYASLRCASARGARRLVTVSPLGVERLLRSLGVKARRAGPPMSVNGHRLIACWIDIEAGAGSWAQQNGCPDTFARVRQRGLKNMPLNSPVRMATAKPLVGRVAVDGEAGY